VAEVIMPDFTTPPEPLAPIFARLGLVLAYLTIAFCCFLDPKSFRDRMITVAIIIAAALAIPALRLIAKP
jgi:hypothetical protein